MVGLYVSKCIFLVGFPLITSSSATNAANRSDVLQVPRETPLNELKEYVRQSNGMGVHSCVNSSIIAKIVQSTQFNFTFDSIDSDVEQQFRENLVFAYNIFNIVFQVKVFFLIGLVAEFKKLKSAFHLNGIAITLFCNWTLAPLLSEWLGSMLFTDKSLQFGLTHESVMLSGVIANTWTVILGGNIHLTLILSIVNAMLACLLQPLWLQTRGKRMLSSDIEIDYFNLIFWNLFCAIAPCVSFFCRPLVHSKTKTLSIRLLKFLSWIHIIGYTAFTISMDVYGFCSIKHLGTSVKLIFVGLFASFSGYLTAWFLGSAFREEYEDRIAIATESTTCSLVRTTASIPMVFQLIWNKVTVELSEVQRNRERNTNFG